MLGLSQSYKCYRVFVNFGLSLSLNLSMPRRSAKAIDSGRISMKKTWKTKPTQLDSSYLENVNGKETLL